METKMVVRAEGFCKACQRRLFVRTHENAWVIPVVSFHDIRSGCCNAYVSHVIQPVPAEGAFLGNAYSSIVRAHEPCALAVPADEPPAARKSKGRK